MAIINSGMTGCPLCGSEMTDADELVAFPAFLPPDHEMTFFSDAAFHRECFERDDRSHRVRDLYQRWRDIWDGRPQELTLDEIEAWGRKAFRDFP